LEFDRSCDPTKSNLNLNEGIQNMPKELNQTLTITFKVTSNELDYLRALALLHSKTHNTFDTFLEHVTREMFNDLIFNADNVKNTLLDPNMILNEYGIN